MSSAAPLLAVFGAAGVVALGIVLTIRPGSGTGWVARVWNGFADAIRTGRRRPGVLVAVLALILLQLGAGALRLDLAFEIAGTPVDLAALLVVAPLSVLLGLFSFATLGIREAIIGGLIVATGHDFTVGVLAATIDRGALILLSLLLGVPGALSIRRGIARQADPASPQADAARS